MNAVTGNEVQAIPAALRRLREASPPHHRVLSVLLDTSPAQIAGKAYLHAFHDGCKRVRADLPEPEHRRFERAVAQVERYLTQGLGAPRRGLAVYASGEDTYVVAVPLPQAPIGLVAWGERPRIEPLVAALDDFERVAVLLFDKVRARLFTIVLDEIEEHHEFWDEVPGKQATGDWFALSQTRYARHHEDHVLRHAKRAIAALTAELKARPFDRLFLAGPDEALALLRHRLPRPLLLRLAGELRLELFADAAAVLAAAREAAVVAERREEAAAVRELLDAAPTSRSVLGVVPVLEALAEARVHRLVVAAGPPLAGRECPQCRRLVPDAGICPVCGGPTAPVADLRERAVELALEQDAAVDVVAGEAASLLAVAGGFGAWTRY